MTTYAAGLRLKEIRHLQPVHIHAQRQLIRAVQGKLCCTPLVLKQRFQQADLALAAGPELLPRFVPRLKNLGLFLLTFLAAERIRELPELPGGMGGSAKQTFGLVHECFRFAAWPIQPASTWRYR
jgi:hypothetical protein